MVVLEGSGPVDTVHEEDVLHAGVHDLVGSDHAVVLVAYVQVDRFQADTLLVDTVQA
jgi:hypothetical protein